MSRAPVTRNALVAQSQGIAPASSDATSIEQARAIAQVKGALIMAQEMPRDEMRAANRMREACALPALAGQAFFRFPRGGATVAGPSIHLATELARCWGNVDYGITELRRDTARGESEMLAYAWDLETVTRVTNTFIVPHLRDKSGGPPQPLIDMRDIYESNANHGARRLRECIFRILPAALIEEAKEICTRTLETGGGVPLAKRREDLLEHFTAIGISRARIERKVGQPADRLSALDVGTLGVVYRSLKRGETTAEEEFPEIAGEKVGEELRGRMDQGKPPEQGKPAELGKPGDTRPAGQQKSPDDGKAAGKGGDGKPPEKVEQKSGPAGQAPAAAADAPSGKATAEAPPDLSPWVVPMPRQRDGKTANYLGWRTAMADRLAAAVWLADVDALREANLDWIEDLRSLEDKGHAQALSARFEEARRRISATADQE